MDLDLLTSDSDLELDAMEEQKPRKKYEYRARNFSEDLTNLELKQHLRVPVPVVDFLEERLSDQLSYPSHRNWPLTARQQVCNTANTVEI